MKYRRKSAKVEAFQLGVPKGGRVTIKNYGKGVWWPEWLDIPALKVDGEGYRLQIGSFGAMYLSAGDWILWDGKELGYMGDPGFRDQYEEATMEKDQEEAKPTTEKPVEKPVEEVVYEEKVMDKPGEEPKPA